MMKVKMNAKDKINVQDGEKGSRNLFKISLLFFFCKIKNFLKVKILNKQS